MFGSKKPTEESVIVLDIESSSVGAGLAHLSPTGAPILFAEQRIQLALPHTLHGAGIAKQIERAVHTALERLAHVAAKLRLTPQTAHRGAIQGTNVFLSAPWGMPDLAAGAPTFSPSMQNFIAREVSVFAPNTPLNFYTNADAVAFGSKLRGHEGTTLLVIVRGEVTELIVMGNAGPLAYGTLPVGSRALYRTLQTHAGLSMSEIPAVLALTKHSSALYAEPLDAAGQHILEQLAPGFEAVVHGGMPEHLVLFVEEPLADWFARTIEADDSLGALFAPGATVRTFGGKHTAPHLGGHSLKPDLHLGLGTLFTQAKRFSA